MSILYKLKSHVPEAWLRPYHLFLARVAAVWYGHPSRELVVIGVTGTNGKTTTSYLIAKALEASGFQTGCTTTALMKVGEREWINRTKMTMPGRFFIQRMLRDMVKAGCHYAVIETSSQGITQFRHVGIDYDVAVFTNLTPEHIEAHGGFENYKQAKAALFKAVGGAPAKTIKGVAIPKALILNREDKHAEFYASQAPNVSHVWYGLNPGTADIAPKNPTYQALTTDFSLEGVPVSLHLAGRHNLENGLAALATARALGVDLKATAKKLGAVKAVPGRLERVDLGQSWTVIIDYAYEPEALARCIEALKFMPHRRLIHVLGSCGGGRDRARRPLLGAFAAKYADVAIITNEDPYDDNPDTIIQEVAAGALEGGKRLDDDLFLIQDRQEAITKAMQLARPGDLVLLTGKGCEPWICVANGEKLPWNERVAAEKGIQEAKK